MKEVLRLDHGVLTHFGTGRMVKPTIIISRARAALRILLHPGGRTGRAMRLRGSSVGSVRSARCDCTEVPAWRKTAAHAVRLSPGENEPAAQLSIAADRSQVGGFSAGAHLAGLLAATWRRTGFLRARICRLSNRPNAAVPRSGGSGMHRGSR